MRRRSWYPGHIAKGRQLLENAVRFSNLILIVLDARAPFSTLPSWNPPTGKIAWKLLNKADLADDRATRKWLDYFKDEAIAVSAKTGGGFKTLFRRLRTLKMAKVIVVGVPNVGKSSVINRLLGKRKSQVGAVPGITRGGTWFKAGWGVLFDTPGILSPKLSDDTKLTLTWLGCLKEDVIWDSFVLPAQKLIEKLSLEVSLEDIAIKRGFLKKGGELDLEKAASVLLKNFRDGRLGRFTLELPPRGGG
ncbi:MAG: 50S ribosome-binding GTPase [Synergistetes bacterium]|nr:50S ribosome-binding GTPase [Synergistota bacterium]